MNFYKKNSICFIFVVSFSLICTIKMASFCLSGGILNPDTALYLISALKYAGFDYNNISFSEDLFFTPTISFLTSLLFKIGLINKSSIIIVTGIFGFLSYIGLYFLLKLRFNPLLSLTGVIIYGSTSVIIFNLAKGLIDIPAISISIWALYFAILAIDKNPKYFLISFPLLVIGFFTKYIVGFMLPIIFLYFIMNKNIVEVFDFGITDKKLFKQKIIKYLFSKEFKYICISIGISIILTIIICKTLILDFGGHLTFFEQSLNTFNGNNRVSASRIFNPDKSFYIDNFSYFLFDKQKLLPVLSNIIYGILGCAILIELINIYRNLDIFESNKKSFQTNYLNKILIFAGILLVITIFIGFKFLENNMISNISIIILITLIYSVLKKYNFNDKKLAMNLLFVGYFLIYLVFISLYPDKTFRYALPLLPPFIYFVVWGLDSIFNFISYNGNQYDKLNFNRKYSKISTIIAIILISLFFVSTMQFIVPMEFERSNEVYQEVLYCGFSNDLDDACDFIKNFDSDYHSKTFASFYHSSRIIRWNLNVNVTILDENDPNLSEFNNATYLILFKEESFDNYFKLKDFGDFHVYHLKS